MDRVKAWREANPERNRVLNRRADARYGARAKDLAAAILASVEEQLEKETASA